jgi:hypothetical protein
MGFDITYKTVIEVNLWHHFFLDTAYDNLVLPPGVSAEGVIQRVLAYDLRDMIFIYPTEESKERLDNRGLIVKQTSTGCFLASKNPYLEPEAGFRISLAVSMVNPTFLNNTNLGVISLNRQLFHLSNYGEAADTRLLLTYGGNESLRAEHFVQRKGRVVRLRQLTPGAATTIEVFDALSSADSPVLTFNLQAIPNQEEYELDCQSLPEGLYSFTSSNNNIDTNLDANPIYLGLENRPEILGVIDLFVAGWEESIFDVRLAKN